MTPEQSYEELVVEQRIREMEEALKQQEKEEPDAGGETDSDKDDDRSNDERNIHTDGKRKRVKRDEEENKSKKNDEAFFQIDPKKNPNVYGPFWPTISQFPIKPIEWCFHV